MTNVAIFLPVLFVRSVAQQLFADMAVTMTVSLLASLLVAVTLVPVLLAWEQHLRGAGRSRSLTGQRGTLLRCMGKAMSRAGTLARPEVTGSRRHFNVSGARGIDTGRRHDSLRASAGDRQEEIPC